MLKCCICKQEGKEELAEFIFQGESLCKEHFEKYLSSMIFLTKGVKVDEEED